MSIYGSYEKFCNDHQQEIDLLEGLLTMARFGKALPWPWIQRTEDIAIKTFLALKLARAPHIITSERPELKKSNGNLRKMGALIKITAALLVGARTIAWFSSKKNVPIVYHPYANQLASYCPVALSLINVWRTCTQASKHDKQFGLDITKVAIRELFIRGASYLMVTPDNFPTGNQRPILALMDGLCQIYEACQMRQP